MEDFTYDVRVYKTYIYKGRRGNTYRVRWKVDHDLRTGPSTRRPRPKPSEASYSPRHAKARRLA